MPAIMLKRVLKRYEKLKLYSRKIEKFVVFAKFRYYFENSNQILIGSLLISEQAIFYFIGHHWGIITISYGHVNAK